MDINPSESLEILQSVFTINVYYSVSTLFPLPFLIPITQKQRR